MALDLHLGGNSHRCRSHCLLLDALRLPRYRQVPVPGREGRRYRVRVYVAE